MLEEARHVLALIGGPGGTIGAFCALAIHALASLIRRDAEIGRPAAILITCIATSWLLLVLFGVLKTSLEHWSPFAVMLLVLAFPDRAASSAGDRENRASEGARRRVKPPGWPRS